MGIKLGLTGLLELDEVNYVNRIANTQQNIGIASGEP